MPSGYRVYRSFSSAFAMMRSSATGTLAFSSIGARGSRLRMASKTTRGGAALERALAGRHLIEHDAEREQIAARIQFLAARLLRRHVGHRPERHALPVVEQLGRELAHASAVLDRRRRVSLARPKSRIFA